MCVHTEYAGLTDEVGMLAVNANRKEKGRGEGGDGEDEMRALKT